MNSQLSNELGELIKRHIGAGPFQNTGEVIDHIRAALREIQRQTTGERANPPSVDSKRLPDPAHLEEMISPPFQLPRLGRMFHSKVNWGADRLPDPLTEE